MDKLRLLVARLVGFLLCLSVAPLLLSATAAVLFRGGGIRSSSTTALSVIAWRANPHFILRQVLCSVLGSFLVSTILALLSLLAWKQGDGKSVFRTGRIVLLIWLSAAVSFPGTLGWVPLLRNAPWAISVLILTSVAILAFFWPSARAGWRELLFAAVTLLGLFFPFRGQSDRLEKVAGRPFSARDIFIIGFDSITASDTIALLERFQPSRGRKIIYTKAQTPFPSTSVAWRSIFSGQYPPIEAKLLNFPWGSDSIGWLPRELHSIGYRTIIAQDTPGSNWYTPSESVHSSEPQGWQAEVQSYIWTAAFPLSTVSADWWVKMLGGPTGLSNRLAHCSPCFISDALADFARASANGPVWGSLHAGLAHGPNQLTLREALRVPGWWHLPATFFLGRPPWDADLRSRATRMETVRSVLQRTLETLDNEGILGNATVFVLADHGPRGLNVPQENTSNIMFAVFSPGEPASTLVTSPVSLVDIAPTIRQIVSLPEQKTDGRALPLSDKEGDPGRTVMIGRNLPTQDILRLLGLENEGLDEKKLSKLIHLAADGTYSYDADVLFRIRKAGLSTSTDARNSSTLK